MGEPKFLKDSRYCWGSIGLFWGLYFEVVIELQFISFYVGIKLSLFKIVNNNCNCRFNACRYNMSVHQEHSQGERGSLCSP